ncbi:MAG: hypothetical protein NW203_04370 [Hyphomonadaceae bacterium]|nr:hypothetical protein [Hyphomonadaceae bacterium]
MATETIDDIDPDTLAGLRDAGIDPALYLKRRAELRAWRRSSEDEAKLAREQAALAPLMAAYARHIQQNGLWYEALEETASDVN